MSLTDLLAFNRETEALAQVAGRLGWDQETVMPRGAAEQRADEIAALEGVLHARRTDPRVGAWLADAVAETPEQEAELRLIRRSYERAVKIPAKLAQEIARVTSLSQGIWAEARAAEDVAAFLPTLSQVVALKREEAAALAEGGDLYDALLDDHEPGANADWIAGVFGRMRPRLVALREAILARPAPARLTGSYGTDAQLQLARKLATTFGYDWNRGRLDLAVHPFSSGSGQDVRITTRVDEADPFNCLFSTIHEVGHACYEQNIEARYTLSALGQGASMGVHESQSRIYENQLGRSQAFSGWLRAEMAKVFTHTPEAEDFYHILNRVEAGFIRTEADEVHYNLHIMMRFDLERALIGGSLQVADLEAAWNERFLADFGAAVDKPSNGVLQDVHWPVGLFGYFPTYALGNVYAGCLHKAMRAELTDLDEDLAQGDLSRATTWLGMRLQRFGALKLPHDTVRDACGFEPDEGPLLDYLEAKFGKLYDL